MSDKLKTIPEECLATRPFELWQNIHNKRYYYVRRVRFTNLFPDQTRYEIYLADKDEYKWDPSITEKFLHQYWEKVDA